MAVPQTAWHRTAGRRDISRGRAFSPGSRGGVGGLFGRSRRGPTRHYLESLADSRGLRRLGGGWGVGAGCALFGLWFWIAGATGSFWAFPLSDRLGALRLPDTSRGHRWSDLQAMMPGEMSMVEGGLSTILRRTKTTGANRRIKELPVCISERAFFEDPTWLAVGFNLLNQGPSGLPAALSPAQDKGERGPREEDGYLRGLQLGSWLWWVSPSWRGATGRNAASDRFSQHGSASSRYFQRIETCWGDGNPRVRVPTSAPTADGWLDCRPSTRRRQEQLDETRGRLRVTSAAG